ncbi:Hypothetical protein PHPALM_14292 [Phytophthora palmivora]|uniref:Uncharacterized protein n=1 Tax=Phytophthora palmivora TaxID=4796 RepID=A0A2P4XV50_9STRA|nr:Hypothetical protein PHPALM_14292 [Phytophthora palmivora]
MNAEELVDQINGGQCSVCKASFFVAPQGVRVTHSAFRRGGIDLCDSPRHACGHQLCLTSDKIEGPSPDELSRFDAEVDGESDDDILAVLHQSRAALAGQTVSVSVEGEAPLVHIATTSVHRPSVAVDDVRGRSATTFRPSTLELQIHNAIGHPDHQGKDPKCILECAQQARDTCFRGSPPVLRRAYDFGFHIRGLSVMHFTRVPRTSMSDAADNMTDFSRKNFLARCHDRAFVQKSRGRAFYNETTVSVLKPAVDFLDDFADEGETDRATAKRLALWINMKLGKFRGLIVSVGLHATAQVQSEFALRDSLLAELLYDVQKDKVETQKALVESNQTMSASTVRQSGNTKPVSKVPKNVSRTLPTQAMSTVPFQLRMFLKGARAHFRPATLSKEA